VQCSLGVGKGSPGPALFVRVKLNKRGREGGLVGVMRCDVMIKRGEV
jgi:hypothetical protein